jgi:hypothetical protein
MVMIVVQDSLLTLFGPKDLEIQEAPYKPDVALQGQPPIKTLGKAGEKIDM